MAQNLDKYRKQLFKVVRENNPNFTQKDFDSQFASQETFEAFIKQIEINKKKKIKGNTWNLINFSNLGTYYRTYACDMTWAQNIGYCTGKSNIDSYVGDYTTDNPLIKKIKISKGPDNTDPTKESLYVNSPYFEKLPKLGNYNLADYSVSKLTQSATNSSVFTLSNQSGESLPNATITFDNTGFTFQFLTTFKIIATKITKSETDNSTKKDDTVVKKDNTVVKKDKDDEIPVVRTKPLYFDTDKEDDTPTKDCGDFNFTLGCVNTKIGDLNAKLFRGDRKKDIYTQKLQDFLYHTGNFGSDNPNKELTKDLWNELMNKSVIKESVKKVLKEYINKKK